MLGKSLLIAGLAAVSVLGQSTPLPDADRVWKLDQHPSVETTGIVMYSGYLNITHSKKQMHYLGVLSKNNPVTDPVLIMLGGGRGCSSLVGYALENGP